MAKKKVKDEVLEDPTGPQATIVTLPQAGPASAGIPDVVVSPSEVNVIIVPNENEVLNTTLRFQTCVTVGDTGNVFVAAGALISERGVTVTSTVKQLIADGTLVPVA